jgi:hypothetical protein
MAVEALKRMAQFVDLVFGLHIDQRDSQPEGQRSRDYDFCLVQKGLLRYVHTANKDFAN